MINSICQEPVFLVGPPRSGTTYLQMLLAEGHHVTTLPETHFFVAVPSLLKADAGGCSIDEAAFRDFAFKKIAVSIGDSDSQIPLPNLQGATSEELMKSIFEWLVGTLLGSSCASCSDRLLEKTPGHCMAMPLIRRLYPDARFVAIIRHPLDTLASQLSKLKDCNQGRELLDLTRQWALETRTILTEANAHAESVIVVTYDQLTDNATETLKQIASKCGLAPREVALSREEIHRNVTLASETWKSDIIGRSNDGSGRQLRKFSFFERCMIDRFCGHEMKHLGFASCSGLPFAAATLLRRAETMLRRLAPMSR